MKPETTSQTDFHVQFKPGFRLSILDVVILTIGAVAALFFSQVSIEFSFVILFVVMHFFLFCNIIRMSRIPELVWAASFMILYAGGLSYGLVTLLEVFVISAVVTFMLVVLELRKPSYHGVYWSKVNPDLKRWFATRNA